MAENEARFRDANDAIEETARELELEAAIPFVCECAALSCTELVRMSRTDYLSVRADPRHFLVVPDHTGVSGSAGVAVERRDGYAVVRKVGIAGEVAEALERDAPAPE